MLADGARQIAAGAGRDRMIYVATLVAAAACGAFISTYTAYLLRIAQTEGQEAPDRKDAVRTDSRKASGRGDVSQEGQDGSPEKKGSMVRALAVIGIDLAVWFLLLWRCGFSVTFVLYALVSTALLGLSVVDLAIYEIPPQFNWFILAVGAAAAALDYKNWLNHLIGMFLVSGIFYLIALATQGKGMGGGDIKLMATTGLLLGWQKILLVMVLGCILGAVIHSIVMAVSKKEHMLAFGPYLSAAAVAVMCYGDTILQWYIGTFLTVH